jgi:hypothetical protein
MTAVISKIKAQNSTISAVVTRADGTVEDFGIISYRDRNPLKTLGWYLVHPTQAMHKTGKFIKHIRRL